MPNFLPEIGNSCQLVQNPLVYIWLLWIRAARSVSVSVMAFSSTFHKRFALARLEQKLRAEAHTVQRLVKGFASLDAHRGSQPTCIVSIMERALART